MKNGQHRTAFFIAWRYLFSKKKHNIINVISIVSLLGIMVSAAALIIVLSVFNGMQGMIGGWFNAFNPDFEITIKEGKSFAVDSFPKEQIAQLPEVKHVSEIVSDMVLATYDDRQELIRLKGVDRTYSTRNDYGKMLIDGTFDLWRGEQPCAVLGTIIAGKFIIQLNNYDLVKLYYPKRTKKNLANPAEAFNTLYLYPTGVFCTNTSYDEDYVFCPIEFARELMRYEGEVTAIEVQLHDHVNVDKCQDNIKKIAGPEFNVRNKYEQEESLFKTMKSERMVTFVILAFILLVAAFNIIGSLGMLIMEKQNDTNTLRTMGASNALIQRIFLYEGLSTSLLGGLLGLLLGSIICILQQTLHIVKLGGQGSNYIISYYPVDMHATDFLLVLATILVISLITSIIPAKKIKQISSHK